MGSEDRGESILLHGDLDLRIIEAKSLPNMDGGHANIKKCMTIFKCNTIFSCNCPCRRMLKHHCHKHGRSTSDPYVSVCLGGATVAQTRIIDNCEDPTWDERYCVPVAHPVANVAFYVKDNDVVGADHIGKVEIPASRIITGNTVNDWFQIEGDFSSKLNPRMSLIIKFRPVGENPDYKNGVGAGPNYAGVSNTYFPLRKGGNVTLYQDAHVPDSSLPEILLDNGKVFEHGKCWEDICQAILDARHLIYIVGWSVYHLVKIVREPTRSFPAEGLLSLGELLKYKAQQGIRVVLLIWDDKTSHDKLLIKTVCLVNLYCRGDLVLQWYMILISCRTCIQEGVMQTHDEETKKFFKNTTVHCVLAPRYASNKLSVFKQQVYNFSH